MLQQMKSHDGVGQRCLASLVEGLDASRKNVMLLFSPLSNAAAQAALTRSLNQCNSANAASILLQEKVVVSGASCEGSSEDCCRHNSGQVEEPPVGYMTQSARRGRVKAASLKVMPVLAST